MLPPAVPCAREETFLSSKLGDLGQLRVLVYVGQERWERTTSVCEQSAETETEIQGPASWRKLVPHQCAELPAIENAERTRVMQHGTLLESDSKLRSLAVHPHVLCS